LPGYYEMRRSGKGDRRVLALHFAYCYVADTLFIYGSMWMAWLSQELGER
jgi:hypothetical protein